MSVRTYLRRLFGANNDDVDGLQVLADKLASRESTMNLTATYDRPTVNTRGEETAVFPATVYQDGEEYAVTCKEFPLPDSGLEDTEAPLTRFLADVWEVDATTITFDDLAAVEGLGADAELNKYGELKVTYPSGGEN